MLRPFLSSGVCETIKDLMMVTLSLTGLFHQVLSPAIP